MMSKYRFISAYRIISILFITLVGILYTSGREIHVEKYASLTNTSFNSEDLYENSKIFRIDFPKDYQISLEKSVDYFPRMYLEGDSLIICTTDGVYVYNLTDKEWNNYLKGEVINSVTYTHSSCFYVKINRDGVGQLYKIERGNSDADSTAIPIKYLREAESVFKDPSNDFLYVGWGNSIFVSEDDGESWKPESTLTTSKRQTSDFSPYLKNFYIQSYTSDFGWLSVSYGMNIYYIGSDFVFQQIGGDKSESFFQERFISRFSFHENEPGKIWFGGEGIVGFVIPAEQGEKSNGEYYVCHPSGDRSVFSGVVVDKRNPNVIYAPTVCYDSDFEIGKRIIVIYKSDDGGSQWSKCAACDVSDELGEMLDVVEYNGIMYMYTQGAGLFSYPIPE